MTAGLKYNGPYKYEDASATGSTDYGGGSAQGYAVLDLGFRYVYDLDGHPTTFRFTVTNVANYGYWVIGQTENGYLGTGRQFAATTEFKW